MSDFIYSRNKIQRGKLATKFEIIYGQDYSAVKEYHGDWGSLATSTNVYNGFQDYETEEYICVVIGGPLLCFRENNFLEEPFSNEGTKAVFDRWKEGYIQWDEDLSGPFVVLILNKIFSTVTFVTDLMSFIPVYFFQEKGSIGLSTHVDTLANLFNQTDQIDRVSEVDFILNGINTFPYTPYKLIRQVRPASEHFLSGENYEYKINSYWLPQENLINISKKNVAKELRMILKNYVYSITKYTKNIAQFISGGEDSRVLSSLLQENCDAFIFLDNMNREGEIAKKVAKIYKKNFNVARRSKMHYLEILPSCSKLVGRGAEYKHAHTYGFHDKCDLGRYSAVFGGLFSDALLKGSRIKKKPRPKFFKIALEKKNENYSHSNLFTNEIFTFETIQELTLRKKAHLQYIKSFRNESAEEWFELWPSSMNMNIPNLHANRRLFRNYEPFMSKDIVKLSSVIPQKWKINRGLFHEFAKPFLKPSKWISHSDGRFPYFSARINTILRPTIIIYRRIKNIIGLEKGNQRPWGDWNYVMNTQEWQSFVENHSNGIEKLEKVFLTKDLNTIMQNLNVEQRVNLVQVIYMADSD